MSEIKVEKISLGTSLENPNAAIHITRDDNTSTIVIEENINGTGGGNIDFWKTRNGATTVDSDYLGVIQWFDDKGETAVALLAAQTDAGGSGSSKIFFKTKEAADTSHNIRMTIKEDGKLGIGTASPDSTLTIKQDSNTNTGGIRLIESDSDQYWAIYNGNNNLQFKWNNGANGGYLDDGADVTNITFTGQHRTLPGTGTIDDFADKIGLIIVSTGDYYNLPARDEEPGINPTINESLPKVVLSTVPNQKSVFGVISNIEDKNNHRVHGSGSWVTTIEKPEGDERLIVNSLGEGAIWVSNINGVLENGDYITTCEIPGYGMKQDDDLLHNYTVAKITQDCTFDLTAENYICEEIEHGGQTYKRAFVGCTYHCG